MKKRVLIFLAAFLIIAGCGKSVENGSNSFAGNETIIEEVASNVGSTDNEETESNSITADGKKEVSNSKSSDSEEVEDEVKEEVQVEDTEEDSDTASVNVSDIINKETPENATENDTSNETEESPQEPEQQPQKTDYGRIFFIGDSRTVDMFDGNAEEIYDYDAGGIRVFARNGCVCTYMIDVFNQYGMDEFDTVVSWLGCNDNSNVESYKIIYEDLLSKGKTLVICTVGPTADEYLSGDWDVANYPNQNIISFNQSITEWAVAHGVKVIDLYSYVNNNIEISPDGIHYNPKPTTAIWDYILSSL